MANKGQINVTLNVEAIVQDAQKKVAQLTQALQNVKLPKTDAKSMETQIGKMREKITDFYALWQKQDKSVKDYDSMKRMVSDIENGYNKLRSLMSNVKPGDNELMKLFPENFQTQLKDAAKAIKDLEKISGNYNELVKNLSQKEAEYQEHLNKRVTILRNLKQLMESARTAIPDQNKVDAVTRRKNTAEQNYENADENKQIKALKEVEADRAKTFKKIEETTKQHYSTLIQAQEEYNAKQRAAHKKQAKTMEEFLETKGGKQALENLSQQSSLLGGSADEIKEKIKLYQKLLGIREQIGQLEGQLEENYGKEKNEAEEEYNKILKEQTDKTKELTTATTNYNKARKDTRAQSAIAKEAGDLQKAKQEVAETGEQATKATQKVQDLLTKLTGSDFSNIQSIDDLKDALKNLSEQELDNLKAKIEEFKSSVNGANFGPELQQLEQIVNGLRATKQQANDSQKEIDTLTNRFKQLFSITSGINLIRKSIRSAFNTIKELDAVMTQTAVVSKYTVSDMWKMLPQYTANAKKLGVAISDVYSAQTLYIQQGLDFNNSMKLGVETLKMARIAGIDASSATEAMTAALRGFNMELNETSAQRVDDVYSKLAQITAADTQQISTAMTKTASIAHSANMEFETTAALLSQIIETTQEAPETAGTAMKTIIGRFTEIKSLYSKGQLEGKDEEGEAIDVNRVSKALRAAGISLNEFFTGVKGLDDIFLELSKKWDTLDIVTQRYIATMAAGSRQQSRFIAMMQDYGRTMELVTAAEQSEGSAQEQFEKTLDSMDAKVKALKDTWQEFVMGILNSNWAKGAVDLAKNILSKINEITNSFGSLGGALAKIGVIVGTIKIGKLLTQIGTTKIALEATGKVGIKGLLGIAKAGETAGMVAEGTTKKVALLQVVLNALKGPVGWILLALTAVTVATIAITKAIKDNQALGLEDQLKNVNKSLKETDERITSVKKEIEELTNQRQGLAELSENFKDLTYNSAEWNSKLIESNQQILSLIDKYPILAKYIQKGEYGQLEISDQGWEAVEEQLNQQLQIELEDKLFTSRRRAVLQQDLAVENGTKIQRDYASDLPLEEIIQYLNSKRSSQYQIETKTNKNGENTYWAYNKQLTEDELRHFYNLNQGLDDKSLTLTEAQIRAFFEANKHIISSNSQEIEGEESFFREVFSEINESDWKNFWSTLKKNKTELNNLLTTYQKQNSILAEGSRVLYETYAATYDTDYAAEFGGLLYNFFKDSFDEDYESARKAVTSRYSELFDENGVAKESTQDEEKLAKNEQYKQLLEEYAKIVNDGTEYVNGILTKGGEELKIPLEKLVSTIALNGESMKEAFGKNLEKINEYLTSLLSGDELTSVQKKTLSSLLTGQQNIDTKTLSRLEGKSGDVMSATLFAGTDIWKELQNLGIKISDFNQFIEKEIQDDITEYGKVWDNAKINFGNLSPIFQDQMKNLQITSNQEKQLLNILEQIGGQGGDFIQVWNLLYEKLSSIDNPEQLTRIINTLASGNYSSLSSIQDVVSDLNEMGLGLEFTAEQIISVTKAAREFNLEKVKEELKGIYSLANTIKGNINSGNIVYDQDDYDKIVKYASSSFIKKFVPTDYGKYVYTGDSQELLQEMLNVARAIREEESEQLNQDIELGKKFQQLDKSIDPESYKSFVQAVVDYNKGYINEDKLGESIFQLGPELIKSLFSDNIANLDTLINNGSWGIIGQYIADGFIKTYGEKGEIFTTNQAKNTEDLSSVQLGISSLATRAKDAGIDYKSIVAEAGSEDDLEALEQAYANILARQGQDWLKNSASDALEKLKDINSDFGDIQAAKTLSDHLLQAFDFDSNLFNLDQEFFERDEVQQAIQSMINGDFDQIQQLIIKAVEEQAQAKLGDKFDGIIEGLNQKNINALNNLEIPDSLLIFVQALAKTRGITLITNGSKIVGLQKNQGPNNNVDRKTESAEATKAYTSLEKVIGDFNRAVEANKTPQSITLDKETVDYLTNVYGLDQTKTFDKINDSTFKFIGSIGDLENIALGLYQKIKELGYNQDKSQTDYATVMADSLETVINNALKGDNTAQEELIRRYQESGANDVQIAELQWALKEGSKTLVEELTRRLDPLHDDFLNAALELSKFGGGLAVQRDETGAAYATISKDIRTFLMEQTKDNQEYEPLYKFLEGLDVDSNGDYYTADLTNITGILTLIQQFLIGPLFSKLTDEEKAQAEALFKESDSTKDLYNKAIEGKSEDRKAYEERIRTSGIYSAGEYLIWLQNTQSEDAKIRNQAYTEAYKKLGEFNDLAYSTLSNLINLRGQWEDINAGTETGVIDSIDNLTYELLTKYGGSGEDLVDQNGDQWDIAIGKEDAFFEWVEKAINAAGLDKILTSAQIGALLSQNYKANSNETLAKWVNEKGDEQAFEELKRRLYASNIDKDEAEKILSGGYGNNIADIIVGYLSNARSVKVENSKQVIDFWSSFYEDLMNGASTASVGLDDQGKKFLEETLGFKGKFTKVAGKWYLDLTEEVADELTRAISNIPDEVNPTDLNEIFSELGDKINNSLLLNLVNDKKFGVQAKTLLEQRFQSLGLDKDLTSSIIGQARKNNDYSEIGKYLDPDREKNISIAETAVDLLGKYLTITEHKEGEKLELPTFNEAFKNFLETSGIDTSLLNIVQTGKDQYQITAQDNNTIISVISQILELLGIKLPELDINNIAANLYKNIPNNYLAMMASNVGGNNTSAFTTLFNNLLSNGTSKEIAESMYYGTGDYADMSQGDRAYEMVAYMNDQARMSELGITSEDLQSTIEQMKSMAEYANMDAETLQSLALSVVALQRGLEGATEKVRTWNKELEKARAAGDQAKMNQIYDEFGDAVAKALGITTKLSREFTSSKKNMDNFAKAAKNDKKALEELRKEAAKDLVKTFAKNAGKTEQEIAGLVKDFDALADRLNSIDFGEDLRLDAEDIGGDAVIAELNRIVQAAGWTQDQMESIFQSMGYNVEPGETLDVEKPINAHVDSFEWMGQSFPGFDVNGTTHVQVPTVKAITKTGKTFGGHGGGGHGGGGGGGSEKKEPWKNSFDRFHNLKEAASRTDRERNKLEREYNNLLKEQANILNKNDFHKNLLAQVDALKQQVKYSKDLVEYYDELAKGKNWEAVEWMKQNADLKQFLEFDDETDEILIDWDRINQITDQDEGSHLEEVYQKLEEFRDAIWEAEDNRDEAIDKQNELIETLADTYRDLREAFLSMEERIRDAIYDARQKEIDELDAIYEAQDNNNSKILDGINEIIDEQRKAREQQKQRDELEEKQRRLTLLRQDTSGANSLEILALEKELAESQENYIDSLVDNALEEISKGNEKAQEQRDMQIELLQWMLDYDKEHGAFWDEVTTLMNDAYDEDGQLKRDSALVKLLQSTEEFEALSAFGQDKWWDDLRAEMVKAQEGSNIAKILLATEKIEADLAREHLQTGNNQEFRRDKGTNTGSATGGGSSSSGGSGSSGGDGGKKSGGGETYSDEVTISKYGKEFTGKGTSKKSKADATEKAKIEAEKKAQDYYNEHYIVRNLDGLNANDTMSNEDWERTLTEAERQAREDERQASLDAAVRGGEWTSDLTPEELVAKVQAEQGRGTTASRTAGSAGWHDAVVRQAQETATRQAQAEEYKNHYGPGNGNLTAAENDAILQASHLETSRFGNTNGNLLRTNSRIQSRLNAIDNNAPTHPSDDERQTKIDEADKLQSEIEAAYEVAEAYNASSSPVYPWREPDTAQASESPEIILGPNSVPQTYFAEDKQLKDVQENLSRLTDTTRRVLDEVYLDYLNEYGKDTEDFTYGQFISTILNKSGQDDLTITQALGDLVYKYSKGQKSLQDYIPGGLGMQRQVFTNLNSLDGESQPLIPLAGPGITTVPTTTEETNSNEITEPIVESNDNNTSRTLEFLRYFMEETGFSADKITDQVREMGAESVLQWAEWMGMEVDFNDEEKELMKEQIDTFVKNGTKNAQQLSILTEDFDTTGEKLDALGAVMEKINQATGGRQGSYTDSTGKTHTWTFTGADAGVNYESALLAKITEVENQIKAARERTIQSLSPSTPDNPNPKPKPTFTKSIDDIKKEVKSENTKDKLNVVSEDSTINSNKKKTKNTLMKFDTGGYTGDWHSGEGKLAMLHQKELVLNATDTANFIQLRDILRDMDIGNPNTGITNYEIHIEVDEISDDYSVEQLADKVKDLIVEESNYRNVNQINTTR